MNFPRSKMAEARTGTGKPDDLITCPICFATFKVPKSLPCLHTFCKECLHTYISKAVSESKPKVDCPICRAFINDFAEQDVNQYIEGLPTNFIVNSLIERDEIRTGMRNCEVCEHLGKSSLATKWCQECLEGYCDECTKGHTLHKILRKHNLMSIKDALKGKYFGKEENSFDCHIHKNRKIELFCFDHAQPCCLTCMTVHHRKCDKVTTLEEAAENFRNDTTFVSFTKRLNELTSELRNERTCHSKGKKELALQLSQIRNISRTKKQGMIKHIEMLYNKFDDDVTSIEKQIEADNQSEILTQKIIQLELLTKTVETLKSTSTDSCLFLEFHKMKGKQNDFEEYLDQYKSNKRQESAEFIWQENVRKFDSVVTSFGKVRVVDESEQVQESKSETVDYTSSKLKPVVTIVEAGVRFTDAVLFLKNTILAVDDSKNAIWAFDIRGTFLCKSYLSLSSSPWGLTIVDANEVVVVLRFHKSLQFITYHEKSNAFKKGKIIKLNEEPRTTEYADNCLYVTFAHKVSKFNLDGTIVNELVIPQSSFLCGISFYDGNVLVADHGRSATYSVHVITTESNPLVKYQKKYIQSTSTFGVTTDPDGNIYVGGYSSNNVIQLSQSGEVLREILPSSSGYINPMGINFSHDGRKFILTHGNKITVFEFQ